VAASYGNILDGMLLYNFDTDFELSCHSKLRENHAPKGSVRQLNQFCHGTVDPKLKKITIHPLLVAGDFSPGLLMDRHDSCTVGSG
jgi:hypothetical protein